MVRIAHFGCVDLGSSPSKHLYNRYIYISYNRYKRENC